MSLGPSGGDGETIRAHLVGGPLDGAGGELPADTHVVGMAVSAGSDHDEPPPLRTGLLALYQRTPYLTESGAILFAFLGTRPGQTPAGPATG